MRGWKMSVEQKLFDCVYVYVRYQFWDKAAAVAVMMNDCVLWSYVLNLWFLPTNTDSAWNVSIVIYFFKR